MNLEAEFIHNLTHHCFPKDLTDKYLRERIFFPLRFSRRDSHPSHPEIAAEMKKLLNVDCKNSINTTVKTAIHKLVDTFGEEMAKDGVNTAPLIQGEKGKHGAWQEVYHWLWNYKFPRWELDWIWRELVKKADASANWIRFTPIGDIREWVVPAGKKRENPIIPLNKPAEIVVDLAYSAGHLLLLNRGMDSRYVVCPSVAAAPINKLTGERMLIPQSGAMLEEMRFDSVGKEEFLGIVVDWHLDFDWLESNEEQPVPIWDRDRLHQLWVSLQEKGNWRGFYRMFDVVEVSE